MFMNEKVFLASKTSSKKEKEKKRKEGNKKEKEIKTSMLVERE